ncbi:MAG: FtsX-like permease family protein [Clostridia bacterium]|jgi:putative permease|nr:FtsX-like permease family protein [Clostridia bacterium]CDC06992.1 efflux ABC transporter permease protein [Clostridium sp. CAG:343]
MKSALLKDSIKEIKNTYKRFLSILVMAFLGVGFFAGMRAASPDMVDTIDQYYKESQVYDIKILSTLGLTNDDIDALSEIDEIENTVGTYETEGKIEIDNKEIITKIMSVEKLNKPILLQGNLPKTQNECVVEDSFLTANHKSIGDTIEVEAEKTKNDEGEEVEYLNKNILKIVGTVKSPLYISRDRGTSSLGSGKIDYYIYVPKENIKANEIYTNIYIKLKNSENYTTSSEKYEEYIAEVKEKIEAIKEEREKARHDKLVDIATRKVKEAEEKLNENKQNAQQQIEEAKQEIENGKNKIEKAEVKLNSSKKEADTKFKSAYNQIQMAKESIFQNETQLNQKEQEAGQQITELEIKKQELQTQFDTIENNLTQLETQYNQIKDNPNISEEQKQMLENKIQMLKQSKQTIKAGIEQINNGITTGKQEIENAKTQLQNAKNELTKKEKQYEATKTATYSSLENAKIEIEKSKTELEKGEKELEEKQEEFKDKIADAESKLIDSREKIANIENPTWYVLDRYSNTGYNSFIQDTESIENISKVFPIVFFMVALLISLTSMTRMVEEQRTQIGTLKALGYNKLQIASKYVIYAGLACVIGGVLGMSVGFVLLPQIIWTMYQMMYQMTDNIHISFNIIIGGMGLLLICVCIIGATIYAVLKELVQTPSTLMRPKAPKMGKRVLLEKIPFIWKRLSFSQKVTVRNIFRYKKRFLMTIIGILGCTALIVVGFGVRDSIRCIMPNQFEKVFNYDMQIGLKNGLEDEQKQKYIISLQEKTELEKVVETYMTSNIAKNQENEEDVQIIVPKEPKDLDEVINLTDVKTGEKVQLEENAICLTDKVAELLNVKQGDTITLKDSKDKERQVKISNIVENYVYHYVYMSRITYENLYGENYNTNMLFTKNNNLSEEQETNLATEIMNQSEVASISRNSSIMNLLDDTMKSLNYVVIILIVSAGLLAFVVLYNLSNVNISERIRELATIKVLGFYDKEVYSYVTRETVILTAIGIVLGLIGGYFLNYFIIRNL